jgi:heterotetrameric sarcosine oxidase gamma subunit
VSAPEPRSTPEQRALPDEAGGVQLRSGAMDIVQIAARRGHADELRRIARGHAVQLPALGRAALGADQLSLCVRPEHWLLLAAPASPGARARLWHTACAGLGVALDLSCGLSALHLCGPAAREVLVRGCRLDLDPQIFPVGAAAATIIAQVSALLVVLPSGVLLLTPSSTARHMRDWLSCVAQPFGLVLHKDFTAAALFGDQWS